MDIPPEAEDYIRESIDHSVGLPVSTHFLHGKLRSMEAENFSLRHQYLSLQSKIKEKEEVVERTKAESSMNALALKKFVDENQKLAMECTNLLAQSNRWERECSLYDQDREALMDFANEADEKAREAESLNQVLDEQNKKLLEELHYYKFHPDAHTNVDVSNNELNTEEALLDSLLTSMFGMDGFMATASSFLEANSGIEVCQKLLKMWNSLKPLTQKTVALASEVKKLEKEKDNLTINLHRAEEEVDVLFEENSILDEENKRLTRQCYREKQTPGSIAKYSASASGKGKRKSSPKTNIPVDKLDFSDAESQREPLSPLLSNSPEPRTRKK